MTKELIRKVVNINSDDNKMLLLNGRYYCQLTLDKQLDVPEHYCFFSESWKEQNCPTLTQYTDCYVLDTCLEKGHHTSQFAKLYHSVHMDLDNSDSFSLLLSLDNAIVSVTDIEIVDKPYPLKKLIDLLDKDALQPKYPEYGPDGG